MRRKNIMIFGGEFYNKGAQAMSFITISRLKSHFPDHNILFISELDSKRTPEELENYNFDIIANPFDRNNFFGENFIRSILGKSQKPNPKKIKYLLKETEYLFDISGYELSSQWGEKKSNDYLNRFKVAHENGIKTIILPQSIGPFNYGKNQKNMEEKLQNVLKSVEIIMPRELQGKQELEKIGITDNVVHFSDIVLTNKEPIKWEHIYKKIEDEKKFNIQPNSVGIIPNMRNFDHGNKEKILDLYKRTIDYLIKEKKTIYLTRHSHEDIKACYLIKDNFVNNSNVIVIEDDMTPSEFENMVKQFDFTIGSRFHSIIHSFKVGVPALILGWAIKYKELATLFNQEKYVFDVRENFDINSFINKVKEINKNSKQESEIIKQQLENLNKYDDPFEYVYKLID